MARQLLLQKGLKFRDRVNYMKKQWSKVEAYSDGQPDIAYILAEADSDNR